MSRISLNKETILNATEEAIRRFGPDKANISDVAKSLKVSHAAIYRYYDGKAALWNAVVERWLTHLHAASNDILKEDSPADAKLFQLLEGFVEAKRRSAVEDAEMFANYMKLAQNSTEAIEKGKEEGINRIEQVIVQGTEEGIFFTEFPHQEAMALYLAMSFFIHPNSFEDPDRNKNIEAVVTLLIRGLKNPNK